MSSRPGLYIHIPFCIKKCAYCSFFSTTDLMRIPDFLAALRSEIKLYKDLGCAYDTVYIGGGTPSLLAPADLEQLIDDIHKTFIVMPDAEITIEANPGDLTLESLTALKSTGMNRLNIGCQSFDDDSLALLGRRHTAREAEEAILLARAEGFNNLGIDLIYGLPQTGADAFATWIATLKIALDFRPEHLSCYQLTLEADSPLAERCRTGPFALPDRELQTRYFFETSDILEEAGYLHYEVSNFAREDRFRSRHNCKYWDHTPYLGLGPSAHSFDGRRRRWNHRSIDAYLKDLAAGKAPIAGFETLTDEQLRLEALFLGFRTRLGIDLKEFEARYGLDLLLEKGDILGKLKDERLVEIRDGFLKPTPAGMAIADSLALI